MTVKWEDRKNPEVIDKVAGYRIYTCNLLTFDERKALEEEGKEAYLFKKDDDREMFVVYYQSKGEKFEIPTEYRLRVDVVPGSVWVATLNRYCDYHSTDFYAGLVVKSSAEDSYTEIFHFYRRR